MIKNRIVVREKSTNKNRTFVLFSYLHLYTFKKMSDIIAVSYTHLFIMIMSVYGRFFRLYLYTAIAPIPLSSFAGEPSQNIGRSFLKSYAAVCLEGAIVVLACIIFSLFASSPPVVDPDAAAVTMVWSYIGELIFNMLVLRCV